MNENYYEILGIDKNANQEQIKTAFKKLAFEYHPDRNPGNSSAEEKFKKINEAYQVLSDPEKKAQYDMELNGFPSGFDQDAIPTEEMLISMFRNFFGTIPDFDFRNQNKNNIDGFFTITIREIVEGCIRTLKTKLKFGCKTCSCSGKNLQKPEGDCPTCNGKGIIFKKFSERMFVNTTCTTCFGMKKKYPICEECNGVGFIEKEQEVQVRIPPGFMGGLVEVTVFNDELKSKTKAVFKVDLDIPQDIKFDNEKNVIKTLKVKYSDIVLGNDKFVVDLLEKGTVTIKLPPRINKELRLKGKGIPVTPHAKERTDLFIRIVPYIPENPTSEQLKAIENLKSVGL
jgi:molecular chaperone DnaJ